MNFSPPSVSVNARLPATAGGRDLDLVRSADFETDRSSHALRETLLRYISLAFKYKHYIVAIVIVAAFLGFVATIMSTKIYSGTTTVKIDRFVPRVLNNPNAQNDGGVDPQFYQTQFELLKSRALAEQVATTLNLAQTDFVRAGPASPSLWARLFGSRPDPARDAADIQRRHQMAANKIMAGLMIQPVALSSIVRVKYSDPNPAWAQRISIAVAEGFEKSTLDRRFGASRYAQGYLEERLQQLKVKLEESEKQLIEYAQREGILDADQKSPLAMAEVQGVQAGLADAIKERLKAEQLWAQAQKANGFALPQVMNDPLINAARARLAQLQATYKEKLNVMKPAFPEMTALRSQITEVEREIRTQVETIKASIKSQFDRAIADEMALRNKVEELKQAALEVRGRSVQYTILAREVDTARSLYDGVLQQFRQLGVASDADVNNVSIVDRAQFPNVPDSPSLSRNLLIAIILGLLAAAALIGVLEILDDTLKTPEDVETKLGLAVLGIAPAFVDPTGQKTAMSEVIDDNTSPMAEAYRSLRTSLQFSTPDGAPKTLLVTSSRPSEGKSTTSAALAFNFAQLGMSVLLIDADLRNPSLHKMMKVDNIAGLSNILSGAADPAEVSKTGALENVTLVTTGPLPPNPAELLSSSRFTLLLREAAENYDVVIIDGPPVMGLADAPIISSIVDGTLLVIESAKTRRTLVLDALKRLHFSRARLLGALLNKFDIKRAGYGYSYGYGYGYGYGYSYGGYGASSGRYMYGGNSKAALKSAPKLNEPQS